jgi:hypothetical protein
MRTRNRTLARPTYTLRSFDGGWLTFLAGWRPPEPLPANATKEQRRIWDRLLAEMGGTPWLHWEHPDPRVGYLTAWRLVRKEFEEQFGAKLKEQGRRPFAEKADAIAKKFGVEYLDTLRYDEIVSYPQGQHQDQDVEVEAPA